MVINFVFEMYAEGLKKKLKACIAVNCYISPLRGNACQWDHTVLPATRQRRTFPAITLH